MDASMDDIAKPRSLRIALDFDQTITADPELFSQFTALARARGHKVICVTLRGRHEEDLAEVEDLLCAYGMYPMNVYMTCLGSKTAHMEALGVPVDIWIDDNPKALVHGW